eukprot:UN28068
MDPVVSKLDFKPNPKSKPQTPKVQSPNTDQQKRSNYSNQSGVNSNRRLPTEIDWTS